MEACLVFGAPSEAAGRGEIVVALLVTRGEPDLLAMRRCLADRLPAWQVPRAWGLVSELESTRAASSRVRNSGAWYSAEHGGSERGLKLG